MRLGLGLKMFLPTLIIRILLIGLPAFEVDMAAWIAWAERLGEGSLANFYSDTVWTQYTPGFLHALWIFERIGMANEVFIKLFVLFGDIFTAFTVSYIVRLTTKKWGMNAVIIYLLTPPLIFVGSIWGQIDGFLTMLILLAVYFLIEKKDLPTSSVFWALSFLVKPQALAALPLYLLVIHKFSPKIVFKSVICSLGTILIVSAPFFPRDPLWGFPRLVLKMSQHYHFGSIFAFNLWALFGKTWIPDGTYFIWGIIIYLSSIIILIAAFLRSKRTSLEMYLFTSLCFLSFFLFPTRIHERYLYPFFAFFLIFIIISDFKHGLKIYFATSLVYLINLYHPYAYYSTNYLRIEPLLSLTGHFTKPAAIYFLGLYFYLVIYLGKFKLRVPKIDIKTILIFAFLARILFLNSPPNEYFDDVYHAFTARRMLAGDSLAWHWSGGAPEGFAYEWTHPPLAKLGMVSGMILLGENSFGWRFPAALLGAGAVYLVYLIAEKFFGKRVALLSGGAYALDGLVLVTSRIGMNDVYFLFFMLASFYLFLGKKHFVSALTLGLAAASKWSVLWFLPVLALTHFGLKRKIVRDYVWFLILPPLIYFASYTPMFFAGLGLADFWEMQKQMWWYHTRLVATHPYTSPWWSWPILLRPIYLYVGNDGKLVEKIYAMGNPAIFWGGIIAVIYSLREAIAFREKKLLVIVGSYFIFFVPWALSPRIMFLYHYLPSIPFMAILIGYALSKDQKLVLPFYLFTLLLFLYFYPHWTGVAIPKWLDETYYWFPSWR